MISLHSMCSQSRFLSINHQRQVQALMKVKIHLHTTLIVRLPNGAEIVLKMSRLAANPRRRREIEHGVLRHLRVLAGA